MAEFCYDCYKKILKGKKNKHELVISKDLDWCEGCDEWKRVILYENTFFGFLRSLLFNR